MNKIVCACLMGLFLFSSCEKEADEATYNGAEQKIGNGKTYSWVKFDADEKPTAIGFTMTKGALDNLPHAGVALVLSFPKEAVGKIPFDHIMLDYLHTGHEPAMVYDVAHFDMHFYTQPLAERLAIPIYDQAKSKFDNLPTTDYLPPGYVRLPAGVPQMGTHWADPTSPELAGKGKFTETLIYGTYEGKVTFMEPMVSFDFLKNKPNLSKAMPLPKKYNKQGYYPMRYSIKQVGDDIVVSYEDLMLMQ
jgi:hypothetical protein